MTIITKMKVYSSEVVIGSCTRVVLSLEDRLWQLKNVSYET